MKLSRLYAILDVDLCTAHGIDLIDYAEDLAVGGVRLFQLRAKMSDAHEIYAIAKSLSGVLAGYRPKLLVNDRSDIARMIGASGVHLPGNGVPTHVARTFLENGLIARSCHGLAETRTALHDGADFVTISPIFETTSPKEHVVEPMGLNRLKSIAAKVDRPVYALGGITPKNVASCLEAGAYGVAVLGGLMTDDPQTAARRYIDAIVQYFPQ